MRPKAMLDAMLHALGRAILFAKKISRSNFIELLVILAVLGIFAAFISSILMG